MAAKSVRFYHEVDGKQWKDSAAKAMLIVDINQGKVKPGDSAKEVQESREEYMKWPATNFRTNMNNLLKNFVLGKAPFDGKDAGGSGTAAGGAGNGGTTPGGFGAPKTAFKKPPPA